MNLRYLFALAIAGAGSAAPLASAAEPLRLDVAVGRALASNPVLSAEDAQLRAVEARAEREALAPPYVVAADLENVGGSGMVSGVRSAEATLRIGRVIELGGKRDARRALGVAEIAQQRATSETQRIDIASRAAVRFIEVVADQERLAFARERVEHAEATRRTVEGWVKAARNPESDLHAAEIALVEAELELEHAEHELTSAKTTLAASWGATEPDFGDVVGDFDTLPPVQDLDALLAKLPGTALYRTAQAEEGTLEARRRVAESGRKPDVSVSLGVRRLEAIDDQALMMSFSMPLGSRSRAGLAVAEVYFQRDAATARFEAARVETHQVVFEKYQELNHARIEIEALRGRLTPKAEQALVFVRRGFDTGRYSFLLLAQAQKTVFDLRERRVEATARFHSLLVEMERLTAPVADATP